MAKRVEDVKGQLETRGAKLHEMADNAKGMNTGAHRFADSTAELAAKMKEQAENDPLAQAYDNVTKIAASALGSLTSFLSTPQATPPAQAQQPRTAAQPLIQQQGKQVTGQPQAKTQEMNKANSENKPGWSFSSFISAISKGWKDFCNKIASLLSPKAKQAVDEINQTLDHAASGSEKASPNAVAKHVTREASKLDRIAQRSGNPADTIAASAAHTVAEATTQAAHKIGHTASRAQRVAGMGGLAVSQQANEAATTMAKSGQVKSVAHDDMADLLRRSEAVAKGGQEFRKRAKKENGWFGGR
jgi:hypothetical protein